MSSGRRARLVFFVLLLGFAAVVRAQTPGASLSGRVVSTRAATPVANAIVVLQPIGIAGAQAQTQVADAEGRFHFSALPAGRYWLRAERAGFVGGGWAARPTTALHLTAREVRSGFVLTLAPGAVITGTILAPSGVPVEGLHVFAYLPRYRPDGSRVLMPAGGRLATTDDRGRFRIFGLSAGSYLVAAGGAVATGYGPPLHYERVFYPGVGDPAQATPVALAPGQEADTSFPVGTPGMHDIRGVIEGDTHGEYAQVVARPAGGGPFGAAILYARTEGDGSFLIRNVPDGVYEVTATVDSSVTFTGPGEPAPQSQATPRGGEAEVQVAGGDASVTLSLATLGEVRGHFDDPEPALMPAATPSRLDAAGVFLEPLDIFTRNGWSRRRVASSGFDFQGLTPGDYAFAAQDTRKYVARAICGGQDYATQPLPVAAGARFDCTLALAPADAVITGTVEVQGAPTANWIVVALPADPRLRLMPGRVRTARAGVQGDFALRFLPPGEYRLFAVPPDPQRRYFAPGFLALHAGSSARVSLAAGQSQTVTLTPTPVP